MEITLEELTNIVVGSKDNSATGSGSKIKIVVLQRGWVMVGRHSKNGAEGRLDNAQVIRVWGTTRGLGEIATNGPTSTTKLDPAGSVQFHELTTVVTLDCNDGKWESVLS